MPPVAMGCWRMKGPREICTRDTRREDGHALDGSARDAPSSSPEHTGTGRFFSSCQEQVETIFSFPLEIAAMGSSLFS